MYRVIEASSARDGKQRVVFTIDGRGPYVEFRPEKEDAETFVAAFEAAQTVPMQPDPVEGLKAVIRSTPDAVVKEALAIDDAKLTAIRTDSVKAR